MALKCDLNMKIAGLFLYTKDKKTLRKSFLFVKNMVE